MIRKCESLRHADKVLAILRRDKRLRTFDITVECFANGREQGYCLKGYRHRVWQGLCDRPAAVVAQSRASDQTVVVLCKNHHSDVDSKNMPDDKVWATKKHFGVFVDALAAQYIAEHFIKNLRLRKSEKK